jgi:uncharacterized protein (TIGR02246 family)
MQSDEQAIRELVATWMTATKAGDTAKILSLMTDDVVFLVPGQPPMDKRAFASAAAAHSGPQQLDIDGKSEIQEINVLGDWAYMWTKLEVIATPRGGAAMTRAGHTLSILRKQSGKWLLARDANLLVAAAKPGA